MPYRRCVQRLETFMTRTGREAATRPNLKGKRRPPALLWGLAAFAGASAVGEGMGRGRGAVQIFANIVRALAFKCSAALYWLLWEDTSLNIKVL